MLKILGCLKGICDLRSVAERKPLAQIYTNIYFFLRAVPTLQAILLYFIIHDPDTYMYSRSRSLQVLSLWTTSASIHEEKIIFIKIFSAKLTCMVPAVKRELTEVVKLVSWFLLDTTDLYKGMRMWVKRWKSREKWYIERWPSTASYRIWLIWSAVKRELTEVEKLVSWFLLDTTDLYKEMRIWVKRWKSREKWYSERWPSTASYRIDRKD